MKIPVRYIGEHEVQLSKHGGPYQDANGKPLFNLVLRKGDTLMMTDEEVLGCTWLIDPRCVEDPIRIGAGRVVLPQDQGKSDEELAAIGYTFHMGRSDFEPLVVQSTEQVVEKKKKEA